MTSTTLARPSLPYPLGTCSYGEYAPHMGVPISTSVGPNRRMEVGGHVAGIKPFGIFKKMDHLPLGDRIAAYHARLDQQWDSINSTLYDLNSQHGGVTLVLLCWCRLSRSDTGPMGCHRRWFAAWYADRFGIEVPELSAPAAGGGGSARRRRRPYDECLDDALFDVDPMR